MAFHANLTTAGWAIKGFAVTALNRWRTMRAADFWAAVRIRGPGGYDRTWTDVHFDGPGTVNVLTPDDVPGGLVFDVPGDYNISVTVDPVDPALQPDPAKRNRVPERYNVMNNVMSATFTVNAPYVDLTPC
ncbi:MAG: hypothetical protein AB1742_02745, partial [bacterium]